MKGCWIYGLKPADEAGGARIVPACHMFHVQFQRMQEEVGQPSPVGIFAQRIAIWITADTQRLAVERTPRARIYRGTATSRRRA